MRSFVAACAVSVLATVSASSAQAPGRHFLWTVTAPGAPTTYLMGSLHVLTPEYYPLSPAILEAFAASTVLIQEVDLDELTNPVTLMSVAAKAMLDDGRTLDQVIPPKLYADVMAYADRAGMPRAALQRMKPWMVALSLTLPAIQAAGFNTEHGVDKHFFDRAKQSGMERRALETVAYQFDRLDQMPPATQEALLRSTIEDLDAQLSNVKAIADAWSRGDTAAIERLLLAATKDTPELYARLLVERNEAWVAPVERCLTQRIACFVVVGAAHLVGPDSLTALLQKKGYAVEQR